MSFHQVDWAERSSDGASRPGLCIMSGRKSRAADAPRKREARDKEGSHPAFHGKPEKCERPNCQSADDGANDDGEKRIGHDEIP